MGCWLNIIYSVMGGLCLSSLFSFSICAFVYSCEHCNPDRNMFVDLKTYTWLSLSENDANTEVHVPVYVHTIPYMYDICIVFVTSIQHPHPHPHRKEE